MLVMIVMCCGCVFGSGSVWFVMFVVCVLVGSVVL